MNSYPLYDVPYLVRDPNDNYMSVARRRIREKNQAVVDAYFVARSKGLCAKEARNQVTATYQITEKRFRKILKWFYAEAKKRKKYDFLEKFAPSEEHIRGF